MASNFVAIILGNKIIRGALANFARSVIYTTAPSFPFVAAIKSGYTLLEAGRTEEVNKPLAPRLPPTQLVDMKF